MFVLASISRGNLHSLYELQRGLGLQPGGIQPVLRRLERDGFLKRAPQERRRRRLITVTAEGERVLSAEWHHALRDYPDPESVLRASTIAILMGDREAAKDYLRGIAAVYEQGLPLKTGASDQKPQLPSRTVCIYAVVMGNGEKAVQRRSLPPDREQNGGVVTEMN